MTNHTPAHAEAREAYLSTRGRETRRKRATERAAYCPTASEQLAVLDFRLGAGVGAQRERARLTAALAS